MASNPACQSEDGNVAVFIGTNLDTGDSQVLCPSCLLQFCATIVQAMTGVPVPDLIRVDEELSAELESVVITDDDAATEVVEERDVTTAADADADAEHSTTDTK